MTIDLGLRWLWAGKIKSWHFNFHCQTVVAGKQNVLCSTVLLHKKTGKAGFFITAA
jgi:hypothetical protein